MNMNKVLYRDVVDSDYTTIKELIGDAFGFTEFIKDEKLLNIMLSGYLKDCLSESSFCKVAEKDNQVIGFILGGAQTDTHRIHYSDEILNFNPEEAELMLATEANQALLKEFSKIPNAYKEIIQGKEDNFQGCIQLFIVSKESRGLGVGKNLMIQLFDYMSSMNVNSLYLFTDTRCNYGFYDSQGFNKLAEKEICFDYVKEFLNIFLYSYDF